MGERHVRKKDRDAEWQANKDRISDAIMGGTHAIDLAAPEISPVIEGAGRALDWGVGKLYDYFVPKYEKGVWYDSDIVNAPSFKFVNDPRWNPSTSPEAQRANRRYLENLAKENGVELDESDLKPRHISQNIPLAPLNINNASHLLPSSFPPSNLIPSNLYQDFSQLSPRDVYTPLKIHIYKNTYPVQTKNENPNPGFGSNGFTDVYKPRRYARKIKI